MKGRLGHLVRTYRYIAAAFYTFPPFLHFRTLHILLPLPTLPASSTHPLPHSNTTVPLHMPSGSASSFCFRGRRFLAFRVCDLEFWEFGSYTYTYKLREGNTSIMAYTRRRRFPIIALASPHQTSSNGIFLFFSIPTLTVQKHNNNSISISPPAYP